MLENSDEFVRLCVDMSGFLNSKKRSMQLSYSMFFLHYMTSIYHHYGNTGCEVFKGGIKNEKELLQVVFSPSAGHCG